MYVKEYANETNLKGWSLGWLVNTIFLCPMEPRVSFLRNWANEKIFGRLRLVAFDKTFDWFAFMGWTEQMVIFVVSWG